MVNYRKIRRIMKEQHIFLNDLAKRINVPYKTLLWQFKNEADIKISMLVDICKVLDIDINEILIKEGEE